MALRDIRCNQCEKVSEWLIRSKDLDETGHLKNYECPYCGNTQAGYSFEFSFGTNFHLKGGGWYKDGYGNSKNDSASKRRTST